MRAGVLDLLERKTCGGRVLRLKRRRRLGTKKAGKGNCAGVGENHVVGCVRGYRGAERFGATIQTSGVGERQEVSGSKGDCGIAGVVR